MRSVNSRAVVSFVFTVPMQWPLRKMVTRSEISSTSLSLWVMMMMAQPSSRILRRMANRRSISCGVSTAVGSSSTSVRAPR